MSVKCVCVGSTTPFQGSGSVTATRMRSRRLAWHSAPNDSCSVLCTRGGGGPRRRARPLLPALFAHGVPVYPYTLAAPSSLA
jgi:hypothetical protein